MQTVRARRVHFWRTSMRLNQFGDFRENQTLLQRRRTLTATMI